LHFTNSSTTKVGWFVALAQQSRIFALRWRWFQTQW